MLERRDEPRRDLGPVPLSRRPLGQRHAHARLPLRAVDPTTSRSPTARRSATTSTASSPSAASTGTSASARKVLAADWRGGRGALARDGRGRAAAGTSSTARFLYLASGYYDYDDPHDAQLPGLENFAGQVVHPQFWPRDLDYAGKRVVVIGSGATAVTIVPAMADQAAHVTMLQRTADLDGGRAEPRQVGQPPAQVAARAGSPTGSPGRRTSACTTCSSPRRAASPTRSPTTSPASCARSSASTIRAEHFQPPYAPWDQRLCLVPDGDFFEAIKAGKASIVTGEIEASRPDGVRLKSGERCPADVVVTATGLQPRARRQDRGQPRRRAGRFQPSAGSTAAACSPTCPTSRWCSATSTPAGRCAPTTTRDYVCRVLNHMADKRADVVAPDLPEDHGLEEADIVVVLLGLPPARARADAQERRRRCRGGSTRTTSRTAATSASARSTTACCASTRSGSLAESAGSGHSLSPPRMTTDRDLDRRADRDRRRDPLGPHPRQEHRPGRELAAGPGHPPDAKCAWCPTSRSASSRRSTRCATAPRLPVHHRRHRPDARRHHRRRGRRGARRAGRRPPRGARASSRTTTPPAAGSTKRACAWRACPKAPT